VIRRFQGKANAGALRQALLEQQCVRNDGDVADAVLKKADLVSFKAGDVLIHQGAADNHIFLILCGKVSIHVNGREVGIRQARQHIGEMALIDKAARRSATVTALEETVAVKVTEPDFTPIADAHPAVWRHLGLELGDRLRERSKLIRPPNPRPVIFIGSSVEGLKIAEQIQLGLSHAYVVPQVWTNNLFLPGGGSMESLENRITTADFGVLVCSRDDQVINEKRGVDTVAPRDNVILELGMCLGAMGRHRAYLVRPRGVELKIPTDLLGITPIDYVADDPANLAAHLGPVCTQIKEAVEHLGPR
jgi:CRP/FNR family transcriptional regulator, cyclic AMP receptor protein